LRSSVSISRGQFDRAISDLNDVLHNGSELHPDVHSALGLAKLLKGPAILSIEDYTAAVKMQPNNIENVLWLHLAHAHAGQDDKEEFDHNAVQLTSSDWPRPIVDLYQGKGTPDDVFTKSKLGAAYLLSDQKCDADFYIGEWNLQRGAKDLATEQLKLAAVECPNDSDGKAAAPVDLKALAK